MTMYKIIIFLALAVCTTAQLVAFEKRNYTPVTYFETKKISGMWYYYSYIPNKLEPDMACASANVTVKNDKIFQLTTTSLNVETGSYQQRWGGEGIQCGPLPSEFKLIFPSGAVQREYEYKILDGDSNYEHYVVVLVIQKLPNNVSLEFVWVGSRYLPLEEKFYKCALDALQRNNIDTSLLKFVRQHDCPSF